MKLPRSILPLLAVWAALLCAWTARAQIVFSASEALASGNLIPDPPLAGLARTLEIATLADAITTLNLTLDISSAPGDTAWNGDLYAQISSPTGSLAVLLNRSGVASSGDFGYSDKGYSVTVTDSAAANIHFYQTVSFTLNGSGQLTGSWVSDGRLDATSGTRDKPLAGLLGENPNGVWTLFVADLSTGNQAQLNSWSISGTGTAVPEPAMGAALIGIGLIVFGWIQRRAAAAR